MVSLGKGGSGGSTRGGLGWVGLCHQQEDACLLSHHFSVTFPWLPSFGRAVGGAHSSSPALPAPGAFLGSAWNVLNPDGKSSFGGDGVGEWRCWDVLSQHSHFSVDSKFWEEAVPGVDPSSARAHGHKEQGWVNSHSFPFSMIFAVTNLLLVCG